MFENLDVYNKILVTGPARSGTHICSKMIAHDTGHEFIPENRFNAHSVDLFGVIYQDNKQFVAPCNGIISNIGEFGRDDTMVICMLRPVEDIMLSGWRIKGRLSGMSYHDARELVLGRYTTWAKERTVISNSMEIQYHDLEAHPLWVYKLDRLNFKPTQTRIKKE